MSELGRIRPCTTQPDDNKIMDHTTTPTTAERIAERILADEIIWDESRNGKQAKDQAVRIISTELERERQQVRALLKAAYAKVAKECPFCHKTTRYSGHAEIMNHRDGCISAPIQAALALLAEPQPGKEGK